MATAQNIIHSSSFNFEYADKDAARRGNDLVESIFVSQILPEIEKAISNKIPAEVKIELSKLEINIGTIEEKEMPDNLPARVRESLERALNFNFSRELNGKSLTRDVQKPDKLFIQSLEMFLVKGFFPFGIEKSVTVDELVQRILSRDDADFSEILLRHRNQKQVVERMSYNLNVETFDKILTAQDPVNSNWIIDFRKILMYLKKELNLNQYSDSEFIKMMNSSILEYMLNETSLTFSKEKFSANMVTRVIEIFNPDIDLLSQAINKYKGNNAATFLINKSLNQLQNKKNLQRVQDENQQLSIDQLLELLNSGNVDFDSDYLHFLKEEIFLAIQTKEKRKALAEQLTASGSFFLLEVFNPDREKNLFKLIGSFAKNIAVKFQQEAAGEEDKAIIQLVLDTILYLRETSFRKLDTEEFILFLISSAGLDLSKIESSAEFRNFIQLEGKLRKGKMASVIDEEKHFSEISDIHKILSESGTQPKKDFQISGPGSFGGDEYSKIYKRKIVTYFLTIGYLPEAFVDLSLHDVQILFTELVQQRDDFLADTIRKKDKPKSLFTRLKSFISFIAPEDLETYFIHFFQEEYAVLAKITDELTWQFGSDEKSYLESKPVKNEIFMRALIERGGENLQPVFKSVALEFLFAERTEDFRIQENLPKLFKAEPDKNRIKRALEQNLESLVKSMYFFESGVQLTENTMKTTVQQMAFFARLSPQLFHESIQKFKDEQELIFTLLKFYLPDKQWESLSQILSPLAGFKQFHHYSDIKGLVELWKASERYDSIENDKVHVDGVENKKVGPGKQDSIQELEQNFRILEFYAQHGFSPWWANQLTFPEIVSKLYTLSGEIPEEFEEKFLLAEKESQIFENLAARIPESARFEIDRLISGSRELIAKWEEVRQSTKKSPKVTVETEEKPGKTKFRTDRTEVEDFVENAGENKELLFRGLYDLTDNQILNQWLRGSREISEQITPYLKLAPYFYFKNTTPIQWREAVYRFSLQFYRDDLKRSKSEFHTEFLKFIRRQYPHVNWDEVLKSVWLAIHRSGTNQKAIFPAAMVRLLNLKPEWLHREKVPDKKPESILSEEEEGLGVRVYNAGIILFWPFLTRFFEHLSFLKNGAFINDEFRSRAVYLLQYLAFYSIDFPEYELVLNKLLTGMLTEDHPEPFVTLTEEEKNLATSLLHGLINNWEKVKNSTPEGIQETFLQREGILRFKHEEVFLEVEKKGVDILVKSIPWNISLIKLPWMKKPMHVEWV